MPHDLPKANSVGLRTRFHGGGRHGRHRLSGKVPIVTGGYSGIGVETARALRSAGARVIVPWRDLTIGGANQVKVFRRGATPELVATIPVGNPERYLVVTDMSDATQVVLRQSTPSTDH